jgi:hypothetical protein
VEKGVGDSELRSRNHYVSLGLLSALPSSSIVLPRHILRCALLLCRYCIYPSLNISRSSLHIFCELDCLLREINLNLLIPVRSVLTDYLLLKCVNFRFCLFPPF